MSISRPSTRPASARSPSCSNSLVTQARVLPTRAERTDAPLRAALWGAGIVAIANVAVAVFWR